MNDDPFVHDPSATVQFWVPIDGRRFGAMIGLHVLRYRFAAQRSDGDSLAIYAANVDEIHAAVRRRVEAGSAEPVILREYDLR